MSGWFLTYVGLSQANPPQQKQFLLCASCDGIPDQLLQSQGSWVAQMQQMLIWNKSRCRPGSWKIKGGRERVGTGKKSVRERREEEGRRKLVADGRWRSSLPQQSR